MRLRATRRRFKEHEPATDIGPIRRDSPSLINLVEPKHIDLPSFSIVDAFASRQVGCQPVSRLTETSNRPVAASTMPLWRRDWRGGGRPPQKHRSVNQPTSLRNAELSTRRATKSTSTIDRPLMPEFRHGPQMSLALRCILARATTSTGRLHILLLDEASTPSRHLQGRNEVRLIDIEPGPKRSCKLESSLEAHLPDCFTVGTANDVANPVLRNPRFDFMERCVLNGLRPMFEAKRERAALTRPVLFFHFRLPLSRRFLSVARYRLPLA